MAQQKPAIAWWWKNLKDGNPIYDIVGQYEGVGTANLWDLGTVRAGNEATVDETLKTFYIWNNKSGSEIFQTMTNCELTVRDGNTSDGQFHEGNADSPVVQQGWVEARTFKSVKDSSGDETSSSWTKLGLNPDKSIAKIDFEALGSGQTGSVDNFDAGEISGGVNDGSFTTEATKNNYAKIEMRMNVPTSAEAGEIAFIARIYYSSRVV